MDSSTDPTFGAAPDFDVFICFERDQIHAVDDLVLDSFERVDWKDPHSGQ